MKTKKSVLIVGACLGLASSVAHSQSSVTMYGVIDEGLHYLTNVSGGKSVYMDSLDGISGSRWGLIGKEDLGGGLKAVFNVEAGINIDRGVRHLVGRRSSELAAMFMELLLQAANMIWSTISPSG
jgi:predicted porin